MVWWEVVAGDAWGERDERDSTALRYVQFASPPSPLTTSGQAIDRLSLTADYVQILAGCRSDWCYVALARFPKYPFEKKASKKKCL